MFEEHEKMYEEEKALKGKDPNFKSRFVDKEEEGSDEDQGGKIQDEDEG